MRALTVATLVVLGCGETAPPLAKVWTPREYAARRAEERPVFGGWAPRELLVTEGERIPYSTTLQGPGFGLPVFPGVSNGQSVGFLLLDIWQDHPEVWIQPVYIPADPDGVQRDAPTIFPVGLGSTFYTAWWQQAFVRLTDDELPSFTSVTAALNGRPAPTLGNVVLCPVMPSNEYDAASAAGQAPTHPLTGAVLARGIKRTAWINGVLTDYLLFGSGRVPSDGQHLIASSMYVFVNSAGPLPLTAILPPGPRAHGWLDRVEVPLPATARVFVPSNRPDLRAALGPLAPDVDPALDVHAARALQVVRNPACLTPADFATCQWFDSEASLAPLEATFRRRPVQVSIAVLDVVTP